MIDRDVDHLEEPFRSFIEQVLAEVRDANLPFAVFETRRSYVRQAWLFATGRSRTLRSKHLRGFACDIVHLKDGKAGAWDWSRPMDYMALGSVVHHYPQLIWGGDWKKFRDYPHVELKT